MVSKKFTSFSLKVGHPTHQVSLSSPSVSSHLMETEIKQMAFQTHTLYLLPSPTLAHSPPAHPWITLPVGECCCHSWADASRLVSNFKLASASRCNYRGSDSFNHFIPYPLQISLTNLCIQTKFVFLFLNLFI